MSGTRGTRHRRHGRDGHGAPRLLDAAPGPALDTGQEPRRRGARMRRHLLADVLKVTSGLHSDQEERHEHLDAIAGVIEQRRVWELHGWLHENLCILDDKANAILTLDSIGLATLTFLFSSFTHATPVVLRVAVIAAALLLLWSIIPLARISFVYWSTTADFREPEAMLNDLLLVRDKRTAIVRASLIKDLAALLVLLLGFVVGGAAWLLARPHG